MVRKFDFWCQVANDNRRIHLYLPDNYDQSDERYAVLYMFDGHNLFFDQDATFGKSLGLKEFLDAWWKRLIVVGIECAKEDWTRVREYCPYDVQSNYYGAIPGLGHQTFEWVAEKLKPYIDANYRTCPYREATAIAGYSMGGMMSLYGVLKFNQVFSKAAVISPAIQPAMEQFRREIAEDNLNPDTRIFFSWGSNELIDNPGLEDRIREVEWLVQQKGVRTYLFRNEGGYHSEAYWQQEVPTWMHFLWE
ncbi:MAG: alpha/beta hydrolase-fold protein [Parabacteroides sp.]|nr:alpha/beta hydrolase-fold protein [bacterium]MDD6837804.1 alpha/beta hydrolase-fold protein [bacterium]MDY4527053.1 alpha/beta hydrolase-fold protein [Parabacteroides sp.]